MLCKEKENERIENTITLMNREKILYDNMEDVLCFLRLDTCEADKYKIKTIFVMPRPDYWPRQGKQGIEYYEWVEIQDAVKKDHYRP